MRAIRVHTPGGPDVLRVDERPVPEPGPGEVVVRVEAVGVNFIDVYHRTGLYAVPAPFTPGSEAAGVVTAVGDGVSTAAVGDRVASAAMIGAYAEYALAPADRIVRLPDAVSTRRGGAVMLQGLTAHYLATSTYPLRPGDVCLVHAAAGGVGLLLCQIARRRGARVIGTVSTEEKGALARAAGAEAVIDYTTHDFVAEVRRITGGRGADVVYDSVGRTTFEGSLDALHTRGMLVLFGQSSGPVPPLDPQTLNRKGSLYFTRPSINHYVATRDELTWRAGELLGWVADGTLEVRIGAEYPLDRAAEAHAALEGRRTVGKVLLVP